jgi:DHA2 family multidrug resistance protein-like MFS transporter
MDSAGRMSTAAASARWSVVAVLGAMALAVFDAGIVNVALPALGRAFGTEPVDTILVVSAYQHAVLIGLLPCAHLAERLGYRQLFIGGIGIFTMASLVCAAAQTLPVLVAARFVQGLGAAAIMALGVALLRAALGSERLAAAIGWNALTVAICSATGPVLGAVLLSMASWHWLFLASIPFSLLALVAARGLPEVELTRGSVDAGAIFLYAATGTLFFGAAKVLPERPYASLALLAAAISCLALLARHERRSATPIIPFDLLASSVFRKSVLASICCFTAQSAGIVALPFYLQSGLAHGPLTTGAVLTCWPVAVAVTSLAASRLRNRVRTGTQCAGGALVLATGLLLGAVIPLQLGVWPLAVAASVCGTGFGLFQLANNRTLFLSTPALRSASAGGMQGTARLTGQTIGTLLAGLMFASIATSAIAPRVALAIGAAFALAAALVSALGAGDQIQRRVEPLGRATSKEIMEGEATCHC